MASNPPAYILNNDPNGATTSVPIGSDAGIEVQFMATAGEDVLVGAASTQNSLGIGISQVFAPNGQQIINNFSYTFPVSLRPGGSAFEFTAPSTGLYTAIIKEKSGFTQPVNVGVEVDETNPLSGVPLPGGTLGLNDWLNNLLSGVSNLAFNGSGQTQLVDLHPANGASTGNPPPGSGGTVLVPAGFSGSLIRPDQTVVIGPGSCSVVLQTSNNVIYSGSGTNLINDKAGENVVVAGSGPALFDASASSSTFFGGSGAVTFINGSGQNLVVLGQGDAVLYGGSGAGTYFDSTGQFTLLGQSSSSTVVSTNGHDVIFGGPDGSIVLFGSGNANLLIAGSGNELLNAGGATGNEVFFAGSGNTTLIGGAGSDIFYGGTGNAIMSGGAGGDLFTFAQGGSGGTDLITDFAPGDKILLQNYGADEIQSAVNTQMHSGDSTTLTLSDQTRITLVGVSSITAGDFQL